MDKISLNSCNKCYKIIVLSIGLWRRYSSSTAPRAASTVSQPDTHSATALVFPLARLLRYYKCWVARVSGPLGLGVSPLKAFVNQQKSPIKIYIFTTCQTLSIVIRVGILRMSRVFWRIFTHLLYDPLPLIFKFLYVWTFENDHIFNVLLI